MSATQILYFILALALGLYIANRFLARGITLINTTQLQNYLDSRSADYFYVDVRNPDEFKRSKIKRFKNIPLNRLESRMKEIPKDSKVVVICQSGNRSTAACRMLKRAGYPEVYNVQGGMNLWDRK